MMNKFWENIQWKWTMPNVIQFFTYVVGVYTMCFSVLGGLRVEWLVSMVCGYLLIRNSGVFNVYKNSFGHFDSIGMVHLLGVAHMVTSIYVLFLFLQANYEVGWEVVEDDGLVYLEEMLYFLLVLDSYRSIGLFPCTYGEKT